MSQAILLLEDGRTFRGSSVGAGGESFGTLSIDVGMSGYQESLTDAARAGQIVVMTAPHIGNTGWNDEDGKSDRIQAAGVVLRDPAPRPSNFRSTRSLMEALDAAGVVAMCDVDTRAITRHLRDHGPLHAVISTETSDTTALLAKLREFTAQRKDA